MGEKRKLVAALDAYRGRNNEAERQKKLRKQAEKRKRTKQQDPRPDDKDQSDGDDGTVRLNGIVERSDVNGDGWETEESEDAMAAVCERLRDRPQY